MPDSNLPPLTKCKAIQLVILLSTVQILCIVGFCSAIAIFVSAQNKSPFTNIGVCTILFNYFNETYCVQQNPNCSIIVNLLPTEPPGKEFTSYYKRCRYYQSTCNSLKVHKK